MAKDYREIEESSPVKRRSITVMVILSVVSLGVYLPYWFLVKRNWFNELARKNQITLVTPIILLFLYSMALFSFIPANLLLIGLQLAFFQYLELIITYIGLVLTLYLSFQVRKILNTYLPGKEISLVLTLFFHVWYLQYKINKHFIDEGM